MEKLKRIIKELLPYIIIIIVVALIRIFIFTPVIVDGPSMMNTLHDNDIMILDKIGMRTKGIKRFNIVVIKYGKTKLIKRVVGLPGETIEYKDNKLYINDKEIVDDYNNGGTEDFEKLVIPDNMYFVLGDNCNDSVDSRIIGSVSKNKILGHATYIIFPFNRFGAR